MSRKFKDSEENRDKVIEIIRLIVVEGLTYEKIAQLWGTTKDYIYTLVKSQKSQLSLSSIITKYDYYKLTGEMQKIADLYINKKETVCSLAKKYNVSDCSMANYLRKEGVIIRETGFESKTPQNIFTTVDTEIKAYVIGLLTADGSINKDNNTITLSLTESDRYLLEQINDRLLDSSGSLFIIHNNDPKPRVVLRFHGKQLCSDLNKYNIVWNKTYLLKELSKKIPIELYSHYLRGLYDGDGVCSYQTERKKQMVRIGFCNYNKSMVEQYRNFLHDTLGMNQNKLFNTGNCWQCSWSAMADLKAFYNYIYKDATIYLIRKQKKLFDYVNTEVN